MKIGNAHCFESLRGTNANNSTNICTFNYRYKMTYIWLQIICALVNWFIVFLIYLCIWQMPALVFVCFWHFPSICICGFKAPPAKTVFFSICDKPHLWARRKYPVTNWVIIIVYLCTSCHHELAYQSSCQGKNFVLSTSWHFSILFSLSFMHYSSWI